MAGSTSPFGPALDLVRRALGRLISSFYLLGLGLITVAVAVPIFIASALLILLSSAIGAKGFVATLFVVAFLVSWIGGTTFAIVRIVRWARPLTKEFGGLAGTDFLWSEPVAEIYDAVPDDLSQPARVADVTGDPILGDEARRWQERSDR